MLKLGPAWDKGDYPVEEINPGADLLKDALGIPEKRNLELRIIVMESLLKKGTVHKTMIDVSEICIHPNELAYANYAIGVEVTLIEKLGESYREKMLAIIESMKAKLKGEDEQEKSLDEIDLNFPEEEEENKEPLVFDDED